MTLAAFQNAFAAELAGEPGDNAAGVPELARLVTQPGFAVYRNTLRSACIDALEANFPAVARLVGTEWFRAAAAVYARDQLPSHPALVDYGATFPDFLERFPPARELPYLAGVALLDRMWTEAHAAADAAPLDPALFATLGPERLARKRLDIHPAARWRWFDDQPIFMLWSRNRDEAGDLADVQWRGEGALLTRPFGAVEREPLSVGAVAFLDVCAARETLARACEAALQAEPAIDLETLMQRLLDAGAFADTATEPKEHR